MVIVVLSSCPAGLRGDVTKWLVEISAGVFVGKLSARLRELLWERIAEASSTGQALMIWSTNNEQAFDYRVKDHKWEPVDLDGITLMRRPAAQSGYGNTTLKAGWSKARAMRNAHKFGNNRKSP
ncbi:type I-E CRISPR-associated endoribonuclease Cas2 [Brevibacterium ravenspurgense]|uniref:Type I-E CRISPR-associated endoribonuclease Cas2 n=1 Tax=Brevibacterium ravenspurgense TaxID=479117 RepID=A0A2I1IIR3_9MICO|nr:type I-E CRISPR-associated endoribonuclease Cas2e [Brevibacterium ravenspurgense]PKY71002.1 type I-E CRISPR-associated endoribonuclease Cas2 [Brevibacterium ravenspurgense]